MDIGKVLGVPKLDRDSILKMLGFTPTDLASAKTTLLAYGNVALEKLERQAAATELSAREAVKQTELLGLLDEHLRNISAGIGRLRSDIAGLPQYQQRAAGHGD